MIAYHKKFRSGKKIFFFALVLVFLLLIAGVLLSPIFKVEKFYVDGNEEIKSEEIENAVNRKNILLLSETEIKNGLVRAFPKIATLKIEKNILKRTIEITLTERKSLGIICKAKIVSTGKMPKEEITNCFYADKEGVIFESAPQTSGSLILLIKDYSTEEFLLGKKTIEGKLISSIYDLKTELLQKTNILSLWFELHAFPPEELKVITSEDWYMLFDLSRDLKSQLLTLKVALDEKIKNRQNLEYVDLRIENRVYYK